MKTITEFNGFDLQATAKKAQEFTASGKTPEETQAAIGELKKIEGDKLKLYLQALDLSKAKSQGLKRIVVLTAAEAEKVPSGLQKVDDHYFLLEYFPEPPGSQKGGRFPGKRGDKKGRGGKRGRGRRGDRGPRRDGAPGEQNNRPAGEPGKFTGNRRPHRPQGPRPATADPALQAIRTAAAEAAKQNAPAPISTSEPPSAPISSTEKT